MSELDRLRGLADVWNQTSVYPANYDMERALNVTIRTIWKRVEKYREFAKANPDAKLPELVLRDRRGGHVQIPESVQRQLDEFRFDTTCLKGAKGVIVTSAQYGAPLNKWFWRSLKRYAKLRGLPLAVIPIKYGMVKTVYQKQLGERRLASTFPDCLKGHILFDDVEVANGSLRLSTARLRPSLQRFLTPAICEIGKKTSIVFGAPILELEHRPRIGHKNPKAIMTTGAVTHPNYHVDNLGQQDRTGLIASKQHCYSAIIVEFNGGQTFHYRQLHATKRGEFYDFWDGKVWRSTSSKVESVDNAIEGLVLGDWHTQKTCPKVRKVTFGKGGIVSTLKPKHVILHDFVDGDSISHHGVNERTRLGYMSRLKWDSLEDELIHACMELDWIHEQTDARLVLVSSNHIEFVREYIESFRWTKDQPNMFIGSILYSMMVEDLMANKLPKVMARATDPVILWFRKHCPYAVMVERKQAFVLADVLLSLHGDKGIRGGRTRSLNEFRKLNTKLILGHNHSATILGANLWRVGTSTPKMQFYVENPITDWTNSHAIVYKNGQVQLITIINGQWHG